MEQRIWHIGSIAILLIALLSVRFAYWPLIKGEELQPVVLDPVSVAENAVTSIDVDSLKSLGTLPQPVQQRTSEVLANITRGSIFDRNGQILAFEVVDESGLRARNYSGIAMAPVVGYTSGLRVGLTGIEQHFNETLLGLDRFGGQIDLMIHQPITGNNVYLTIDSQLQKETAVSLGNRAGAVVVMDARSGAILALVSQPTFDPNQILNAPYMDSLMNCTTPDCQGVLTNRATQGLYVPGSTWKAVTLIAALDSGQVTPETVFDFGQQQSGENGRYYTYQVDGAEFQDPNHSESRLNLVRSFAVSANATFARLGDEMPPDVLINYAQQFGFSQKNNRIPLEIQISSAQLANDLTEFKTNNVLQASTGFGQGELLTSPLNMALIIGSVLNEGNIPIPHLLQRIESPDGKILQQEPDGYWATNIMRPETAQQVRDMLITAVQSGSGVNAAVPGLTVGGKTGTAEPGGDQPPHAWFIGFAEEGERTLVIVVLIENGGEGSTVAAPLFAQIARLAFQKQASSLSEKEK